MAEIDSKLSSSATAQGWISQFEAGDQDAAATLLDRLTLMNESEVADRIFQQLEAITVSKGRIALYAEREIAEATAFPLEEYVDAAGKSCTRAVPSAKFMAVKPKRGATRVGSEGWMAFLISQAVKANPKYVNHPSPAQYTTASPSNRISRVVIVTDFIGSGDRIWTMLEKFWRVPTFAAWWSRGYIRFHVVAAAGTSAGIARIKSHKCGPTFGVSTVIASLTGPAPKPWAANWLRLANFYGRKHASPLGHKNSAALVAFDYGMPNNVPAILVEKFAGWKPFYRGRAPKDLRPFFGLPPTAWDLLRNVAEQQWTKVRKAFSFRARRRDKATMLSFLIALRGRWHADAEIEVAERSGLQTDEVIRLRKVATTAGWISERGRITDSGRKLLKAGTKPVRKAPKMLAGSIEPYYPTSLRVS